MEQIIDYGQRTKGTISVSAGVTKIWSDESDFSFSPSLDGRVSVDRKAFVPIRAGNNYTIKHGAYYVFDRNQTLAIQFPPDTYDPNTTPGEVTSQVIDPSDRLSGSQFVTGGEVVVWEDSEYYAFSPTMDCRLSIANNVFIDITSGERIIIRREFDYVFDRNILIEVGFPPQFFQYPDVDVGGGTPIGGIIMYNGYFSDIPDNWSICNGTNGTPDLRNQFIMGAYDEGNIGDKGGSRNAVVVAHGHNGSQSSHSHSRGSMNIIGGFYARPLEYDPYNYHTVVSPYSAFYDGGDGSNRVSVLGENVLVPGRKIIFDASRNWSGYTSSSTPSIAIGSAGESGTDKNLPPYYKLAFIRRMI